jgi:NAD(P)-dependent dehydrogenase (short-subunit alcohol dehydrogenase family)
MPERGEPLRKLGFLTIGRFDPADPGPGHEETLQVIERAEALGFDSVWLRDRHLQPGISSPVAIMAAASQRTTHIELGTAVIPLGLENPFRLAEDLATVDILSGGRINPGVSVGTPMHYDNYRVALYPETHDIEDFSKERVLRLLRHLRGEPVSDFEGVIGIEQFTRHIQPHSPGLADRLWYGGGMSSAKAALESDTRTLAFEAGRTWGTRVNTISAGPYASRAASAIGIIGKMIEYVSANAPLTDKLTADEVGKAAAFLASPLASVITGSTVYVDKGYHAMGLAVPESPTLLHT